MPQNFMSPLKVISRIDLRMVGVIIVLMILSLLVISSVTAEEESGKFFTPFVINQIKWFCLGWALFFLFTYINYHRLKEWTWLLYLLIVLLLVGLFLTSPLLHVRRWYRLPIVGLTLQPSEFAKLTSVLALAWLLDRDHSSKKTLFFFLLLTIAIPFLLILKQPDLGSALVLYPIFLVMCYYGRVPKRYFRICLSFSLCGFLFISLIFMGGLSHKSMKPFFSRFLKEYQYERLNPSTYHQRASQAAIALGGIKGSGWKKSSFSSQKWLPAAHTDSVFAAFGEEFGAVGIFFLLMLFYLLIHFGFQVSAVAKDRYGQMLAAGLSTYLSMHILMNILMMCGFLPISGVPLTLLTYGGNSILTTMASLGMLQSIYVRRFMF